MKLLATSRFAEIYLVFTEGIKYILKKYHKKLANEPLYLEILGGSCTPRLISSTEDTLSMEYIEGVSLDRLKLGPQGASESDRIELIFEIIKAYIFIHSRGILHLDPKPSNIFITFSKTMRVIDFNVSSTIANPRSYTGEDGLPLYWYPIRPPESFHREFIPTIQSEIYSLGHLFYYIYHGHFLIEEFLEKEDADNKERIKNFHENIDKLLLDKFPKINRLISSMIEKMPENRPRGMDEIIKLMEKIL